MSLKQFIIDRKLFFIIYLLSAIAVLVLTLVTDQLELHLAINQALPTSTDVIAKYITYLGDGRFAPFLLLLLLITDWRKFLIALSMMALAGLIITALKQFAFPELHRPILRFDEGALRFVDGVKMHMSYTFPSGHSGCVMSLAMGFLLWTRNNLLQLALGLIVIGAAFSRVYLSQHFMEDILAGTAISLVVGLFTIWLSIKLNWLRLNDT